MKIYSNVFCRKGCAFNIKEKERENMIYFVCDSIILLENDGK